MTRRLTRALASVLITGLTMNSAGPADAAAFVFAGEANGIDIVTHVKGYVGTGGNVHLTVGIDPTSANAASMVIPTQNVINTFNGLQPTTGNFTFTANVPSNRYDFESVLLHEMGHALGLAHCNAASESGLTQESTNYTKASDGNGSGSDNETAQFSLDDGADNIIGSADDVRGDDLNLNWFNRSTNNPGSFPAEIDHDTYSRDTADLPGSHPFAANADRSVLAVLGVANTESVMNQGTFNGEAKRTLHAEDVAALRIAMAGLDENQGTSDDYTFSLSYAGLTAAADIVIDFDAAQTNFAVTLTNGTEIVPDSNHIQLTGTIPIYFEPAPGLGGWFFNQVPNGDPNNVFVNFNSGTNGSGSEGSPFDNLADAIDFANPGADINLEPGSSSETFTGGSAISKALTLHNNSPGGGAVIVGN